MAALLLILIALCLAPPPLLGQKDLRTKEQRLYQIKLRNAQWQVDEQKLDMETKQSDYDEIQDLFNENIGTLEELNQAQRAYQQARLGYEQAVFNLEKTRLEFLEDATHITVHQAKKYRTPDGRRQLDVVLENASNLKQAASLNPDKDAAEVRALLELQNAVITIERPGQGLIIAEPYEVTLPSLALGKRRKLTFRLLQDEDDVLVRVRLLDGQVDKSFHLTLKREALQDMPSINSIQFSQEGELNSRLRFDLILERLAEDEKTFRLAVVNLPAEIDFAFVDPQSSANLTQIKFSDDAPRHQLELELQIPEKLSRRYIDQTIAFYVFITDQEGFNQIGKLNRSSGNKPAPLEALNKIKGSRERLELVPRGRGNLEMIVANPYQEVKVGDKVTVRVDLLNAGTLQIEGVHLVLTPPLGWTYSTKPDTISQIEPGEKEPVNVELVPPDDLGVSEYDVRFEAIGYAGNDKVEAQEKDIAIRIEARAAILRNALLVGGIIALVVAATVFSIRVSRR